MAFDDPSQVSAWRRERPRRRALVVSAARDSDVAQAFADDYRLTLQRAARFPRAGKRLRDQETSYELRRFLFKTFRDYYLVVGLKKRTLVLVAVASSKRKYGYWKPRLAKVKP